MHYLSHFLRVVRVHDVHSHVALVFFLVMDYLVKYFVFSVLVLPIKRLDDRLLLVVKFITGCYLRSFNALGNHSNLSVRGR